ncbi:MAG: PD-(D/E)XK nuclease family protein [Holophagaceae bacterium]|nr:PD-(D/E)XK nuclease family protein [Holophagaceae bacterium]
MAFSPFEGVLLDDPREPIPGALAVLLHLRVERQLAMAQRRARLPREAVLDRSKACQELLRQGLLPGQVRQLAGQGLRLGSASDAHSLVSLLEHVDAYLEAVDAAGFLEPYRALWEAAERQQGGGRGFWVERAVEDGPLLARLDDLAPPRLRALMAMPGAGTVRFQLATERGSGARGLFDRRAPHLVDQLLPNLETAASDLEHFEIETPVGWAENPWGSALDGLFEGPLKLDEEAGRYCQRGLLPTPFAVLRAAVEQAAAWVEAGIEPHRITLIHPDPESIGDFLHGLLQAEGLGLASVPGRSLDRVGPWTSLLGLFEGLLAEDPQSMAEGLLAAESGTWRDLAEGLMALDQTGAAAIRTVPAHAGIAEPWGRILSLRTRREAPGAWAEILQRQGLGLGLVRSGDDFYGIIGLLKEAWGQERGPWTLADMLDALRAFLEVGTEAPQRGSDGGIPLISPSALLKGWQGAQATLLLDLGEGSWPAQMHPPADLDWDRRAAINTALRAAPQHGGFPPALQAFWLPRAEMDERLPRSFHRDAFAFNTALALTRERLVALSSATDAEGQGRSQGIFWKALEGAGEWRLDPSRSFTGLRHRWDSGAGALDGLASERQSNLCVQDPGAFPALHVHAPEADWTPGWWMEGGSEDRPLSPTRLESLARCPFRVLAERGLGLSSWRPGKRTALDVGTVAHALMQRMLEGLEDAAHWPEAFQARHALLRKDAWTLESLLQNRWEGDSEAILSALREPPSPRDRERLKLAMEALIPGLAEGLAWDLAQEGPTKAECECLGLEDGEDGWKRSLLGLELEIAAQDVGPELGLDGPLWIRGQVDRLERWAQGADGRPCFLRVVDYKTSSRAHLAEYQKDGGLLGPHLQLPLYQWLVERSFGMPATALLWPLKESGSVLPAMFAASDEERRSALKAHVKLLVERARAGDFPAVAGNHCGTCALSALCGRPVDVEDAEAGDMAETAEAGAIPAASGAEA